MSADYVILVLLAVAALLLYAALRARARALRQLDEVARDYQSIFENATTGIYQTTRDGRYVKANPMLAQMLGYESPAALLREVQGERSLARRFYVVPGRRDEFARLVEQHDTLTGFESEVYRRDGSRIWISEHALAIRDAQGQLIGFQGTTIEITDRVRAQEELQRAYAELELRVAERTAELARSNDALRGEISERQRAEEERARNAEKLHASREQLRALSAHLQSVREDERAYIAREVHDELGQTLTGLMWNLSWLKDRLAKIADAPERALLLEKLRAMIDIVGLTMDTVRKIAAELRPGVLDELGLKAAVARQAQEFEKHTGIRCRLLSSLEDAQLDRGLTTAVFRIVQESLTNVARHAQATEVRLALAAQDGNLVLEIEDDGRGISEPESTDRRALGILGMRERALLLSGSVNFSQVNGHGTRIVVRIPFDTSGGSVM